MIKYFLFSVFIIVQLNAQKLIHRVYSTDEGLVNGQVETIFEDSKGYMWFGTYGGASKWNGTSFINYKLTDGLGSNQVFDIEEDNDGKILFATYGAGVSILDNNKIYNLKSTHNFSSIWISCLFKNKKGEIYFGGIDGELYLYNNNKISIPNFIDKLPKNSIWDIFESSDGSIYIGTYGGGLVKIFNGIVKVYTINDGLINNSVWSIKEDNKGKIWVSTSGGISILENEKFTNYMVKDGLPGQKVYSGAIDKDGTFYGATDNGIVIINNKILSLNKDNGLPVSETWEAFVDSRGIVYFGSAGEGFSCLFNDDIISFKENYGAISNNFHSFVIDNKGDLLAGTENGILIYSNNKFENYISASQLNFAKVNSLAFGSNDKLFIGTNKGLAIKSKSGIKWLNINNGLPDNDILLIKKDINNKIFAATRKGVAVIEDDKISTFTEKDGLRENYTRALYCANDGTVYFGSYGKGISYYNNEKWDSITSFHGLPDEHINTIFQSKNGTLFVGTYDGGLFIYKGVNNYKIIQEKDGLLSNSIVSISEDNEGIIYVGTFKGISTFNPEIEKPEIYNIRKDDGLPGSQGYRDALIFDNENNLWFGTISGAAKIFQNRLKRIQPPPFVYIDKLTIFEHEIDLVSFYSYPVLDYDQNYIKLEFAGVDYFSPNQVLCSYQLVGVDKSWISTDRNFVQYTNLLPGNYTFNIKSVNSAGIWSENYSLSFIIKPAYWQTWWFITLIILAVSGLVFFLIYYKLKQVLAVEKFRSKIAADLHDNIGSGLSEISILSEVIKYKSINEIKAINESIDKIAEIARKLVDSMSEVVWLANPNKDKLRDIVTKLIDNYQPVCFELGISLNVNGLEFIENISFSLSDKHHLFLFIKEAINNSIKYSKCSVININVKPENNLLLFIIEDNGIGFNEFNVKKGYGLESMKMRSKELGGSFNITSSENNGTTVTLILNLRKFKKINKLIK